MKDKEIVAKIIRKAKKKVKYFLDTEFVEDGITIDLISIAVVSEDGKEFYAVSNEFDKMKATTNDFVYENVLPNLPKESEWVPKEEIKESLLKFIGDKTPEFWGYYPSYDWVVVAQLFGRMVDLPENFPKTCFDLKQLMVMKGVEKEDLTPEPENAHDALADAKWDREVYDALKKL